MAFQLGTFSSKPDPPQTQQLLGDRVLNELAPARKQPPFDELVDLLEGLWIQRDGDLGAAHADMVSPLVVPKARARRGSPRTGRRSGRSHPLGAGSSRSPPDEAFQGSA